MKGQWVYLMKHQVGSAVATAVDFLVMIGCVEIGRLSPVTATAIGAASGAVTNFTLGRRWIFGVTDIGIRGQAFRYAMVSGGSLALNSLGEYLVNGILGVRYVTARILVALAVGVLWNFPLHKRFVFKVGSGRP